MLRFVQAASAAQPEEFFNNGFSPPSIEFLHPGYPDTFKQNLLLTLNATDHAEGGFHHRTAWLACAIIAGNAWTGYLSLTRERIRIVADDDELLTGSSYYFHIPRSQGDEDDDTPYAIYPSFQHWAFPHNKLPQDWTTSVGEQSVSARQNDNATAAQSALSTTVINRDGGCVITASNDYITAAHLCPRSEKDWFFKNGMAAYNVNVNLTITYVVDDVSNAVSLRPDLHRAFDDKKFVIVPKSKKWLIHFIGQTNGLGKLYHNTDIVVPNGVKATNLLVRFAWAIFPTLLRGCGRRRLRMCVSENGAMVEVVRDADVAEYNATANRTQSRSASPKKRREREPDEVQDSQLPVTENAIKRRRVSDCSSFQHRQINVDTPAPESVLGLRLHLRSQSLPSPLSTRTREDSAQCRAKAARQSLEDLKQNWIKAQRPSDASLYCCNYEAVEADIRAGRPGREELDGAYLCHQCLGFEFRDDDPDRRDIAWDSTST